MKAHIWRDQVDFFEISVLEQTAQPDPAALEELAAEAYTDAIVLVGRGLSVPNIQSFRDLASRVSRTGATLLVCPPFGDTDIGRYFDTPVSLRLVRRSPDATVKVMDGEVASTAGPLLTIRSDQFIETALGANLVAVDGAGKPTLIRYQTSNRAGAIFISTIQLLSYTAISSEPDRQALLLAVLRWHNRVSTVASTSTPGTVNATVPDRSTLVHILLALAAGRTANVDRIDALIRDYLGATLPAEHLEAALQYLSREGVLISGAPVGELVVSEQGLGKAIDAFGLDAYAREFREMVTIAKENT